VREMSRVRRWWPWARNPTGETHETGKRGKEIGRFVTSGPESGLPGMDFEDFYGRYVDRVVSYVLRHTSLRDAEDIVAETFTVAWRKRIERLDDPMPWLIVTARNITRQVRRKEVSAGEITARLVDLIETASPSAEITALRRREITDALASLDDVSREALLLTTWDGLSGIDAARVLGITPGALRVRVHRARTTMKEVSVHD